MYKLTTALLIGLAHSAAVNLTPRQDDGASILMCHGSCELDSTDAMCIWQCPNTSVCGDFQGDCPVALPEPIEPPSSTATTTTGVPEMTIF